MKKTKYKSLMQNNNIIEYNMQNGNVIVIANAKCKYNVFL